MDVLVSGCMYGWLYGWVVDGMDERLVGGCMDRWMDGWVDVWVGGFFVHPYDFIVHIIFLEGIRYFVKIG